MSQSQEQSQGVPQLCSKGCGFFANAATMGMCSKCFREEQATQEKAKAALAASVEAPAASQAPQPVADDPVQQSSTTAGPVAMDVMPSFVATPAHAAGSSSALTPADAASPAPTTTPESSSKTSTRCQQCRKKVGLTGFKCKCGMLFCGQHRYAESHSCTFDYKTAEREKLAANNPLVQASKVERI